jgi:hypothetical protein
MKCTIVSIFEFGFVGINGIFDERLNPRCCNIFGLRFSRLFFNYFRNTQEYIMAFGNNRI